LQGEDFVSVYTIARQEAERRAKVAPKPHGAAHTPATPLSPPTAAPTAQPAITASVGPELGKALESIGTYIPTEVITTYLTILTIIPTTSGHRYQWLMLVTFLIATPIVVWLGVSAAHPGQGLSLPVTAVRSWPWLAMLAASLAFAVFAIGVPGSVINDVSWFEPWMSTGAIILSAFVLSQVNRIAQAIAIDSAKRR